MLNWYFEFEVLKYPALMVSEKTLKIPSIESTDSLELLIKEWSYLPFPLWDLKVKTIIRLGSKLCQLKFTELLCCCKGTEYFHSLDYLFIQASVFMSAWPLKSTLSDLTPVKHKGKRNWRENSSLSWIVFPKTLNPAGDMEIGSSLGDLLSPQFPPSVTDAHALAHTYLYSPWQVAIIAIAGLESKWGSVLSIFSSL